MSVYPRVLCVDAGTNRSQVGSTLVIHPDPRSPLGHTTYNFQYYTYLLSEVINFIYKILYTVEI